MKRFQKLDESPQQGRVLPHRVIRYGVLLSFLWTAVVAAFLIFNLIEVKRHAITAARVQARSTYEKDILYRRWNAMHGGIYVPVTDSTPPNPYLDNDPERDITLSSGKRLTKVNPAYMTRQVHELGREKDGVQGHITSLRPIRPENRADAWETDALNAFEKGVPEVSEVVESEGKTYLRLMRPLITEESCLKCHERQGYKAGNIRGGISVLVPMAPYLSTVRTRIIELALGHGLLWFIGLSGIVIGTRRIHRNVQEREQLLEELKTALADVKKLSGLLPICASCKKIRDDKGYWTQIETYIQNHSEAEFTHGLCEDCIQRLYPERAANHPR